MKIYRDFKSFANRTREPSRRLLLLAVALMLGACAIPQVGQVVTAVPEANASPVPLDSTILPSSTQENYEITPTVENSAAQALTQTSVSESDSATPTSEDSISKANIPNDLHFIDGRNVKEMVSKVDIDAFTGLESAYDEEGNLVAYHLKSENEDLWVVNPLLEKGYLWNFDINEDGQVVLLNALEEWKYKPYPIEGIKFVKPDDLPVTFWDESHPVKEDEAYPWPEEGTLAVFDGEGDILMYYSKYEDAWWYAGFQSELPGNMVFRQSSSSLALTGIRYKPVDETVWKGTDLAERWQEMRNRIDWLAYTKRTGNFISLEYFSSRVRNGEVFHYQSWLFDLATDDFKLVTLSNNTKINVLMTMVGAGADNSYSDLFNGEYHGILHDFNGVQINPDNSISIINGKNLISVSQARKRYNEYLQMGFEPFMVYTVGFLATNDVVQKEGIILPDMSYHRILSPDEITKWKMRLFDMHQNGLPTDVGEYILSQFTPIIYPNVDNLIPFQSQ